jgi:hypothetical protein
VAFGIGMVMNLPSVYYLAALPYISQHYPGAGARVALILMFNAIQFTLVEVPIVGYLISPERTAERAVAVTGWLAAHGRRIAVAVIGVVGVYLIVHGIVGLVG